MKARLVVVGGLPNTREIRLRLPAVLGRGRDVTIQVPHPLVSRRHCELYEVDGVLHVRDLGSLNGTFVGNQRVQEAVLPHEELLTIGNITFRVLYDNPPKADREEEDSTTSHYPQVARADSSAPATSLISETDLEQQEPPEVAGGDEDSLLPPALDESNPGT